MASTADSGTGRRALRQAAYQIVVLQNMQKKKECKRLISYTPSFFTAYWAGLEAVAIAAAATTGVTAAVAAAITTTVTTTTTARTLFTGTSFVNGQIAVVERVTIEALDGFLA